MWAHSSSHHSWTAPHGRRRWAGTAFSWCSSVSRGRSTYSTSCRCCHTGGRRSAAVSSSSATTTLYSSRRQPSSSSWWGRATRSWARFQCARTSGGLSAHCSARTSTHCSRRAFRRSYYRRSRRDGYGRGKTHDRKRGRRGKGAGRGNGARRGGGAGRGKGLGSGYRWSSAWSIRFPFHLKTPYCRASARSRAVLSLHCLHRGYACKGLHPDSSGRSSLSSHLNGHGNPGSWGSWAGPARHYDCSTSWATHGIRFNSTSRASRGRPGGWRLFSSWCPWSVQERVVLLLPPRRVVTALLRLPLKTLPMLSRPALQPHPLLVARRVLTPPLLVGQVAGVLLRVVHALLLRVFRLVRPLRVPPPSLLPPLVLPPPRVPPLQVRVHGPKREGVRLVQLRRPVALPWLLWLRVVAWVVPLNLGPPGPVARVDGLVLNKRP